MGKRSDSTERRALPLALLSGALLGMSFLPLPLGFIAWGAFVPLLAALDARLRAASGRSLFGLGWACGFAFYLIGIHWIALLSSVSHTACGQSFNIWVP